MSGAKNVGVTYRDTHRDTSDTVTPIVTLMVTPNIGDTKITAKVAVIFVRAGSSLHGPQSVSGILSTFPLFP